MLKLLLKISSIVQSLNAFHLQNFRALHKFEENRGNVSEDEKKFFQSTSNIHAELLSSSSSLSPMPHFDIH